ncbi:hypothetical protein DVH02_22325 [Streptomyces corynorhini]|uniref:Uncharacterized protein n=1 Tax=Streptomyces corynorhini TaxID=2282652 RepID=A0A370B780_9ACTN|nr:hypothetical protein DVH02_22325 [Streptomyces corynorhini]
MVAVVLAALIHVLACAHGPQTATGPRADSLPLVGAVLTASEAGAGAEAGAPSRPESESVRESPPGPEPESVRESVRESPPGPEPESVRESVRGPAPTGCCEADEPGTVDPPVPWTPPGAGDRPGGRADAVAGEALAPEPGRAGPGWPESEWGRAARVRAVLGVWRT